MSGSHEKRILIGLSGGVDSAVAAFMLKEAGYEVSAVFMKNFSEQEGLGSACPWKEDRLSAYQVAAYLNIKIETWDFQKEYHNRVVEYLFSEYQKGRTPNPDIMCNKEIKFKVFLNRAKEEGFDQIATGHYARLIRGSDMIYHLLKGVDPEKDQSYFLSRLSQDQLRHVVFPIGELKKKDIREKAREIGLPNAERADSQGICFIGEVNMKDFLKHRIKPRKGDIVDISGTVLGRHDGVYYYTIGQRRGIDIGGGPALYVIDKDIKNNKLIVGKKDQLELFKRKCVVSDWHWVGEELALPLRASGKIRYRQSDQPLILEEVSKENIRAVFDDPQRAVSSGQVLVAYIGDELVGSGIIE